MENASNAIIMAGAVLIFVIALTIGVLMYTRIIDVNDMILTNSEQYSRTAESLAWDDSDIERVIPGAEVANQILEMAKASNNSQSSDFHYNRIEVLSYKFTPDILKNTYGVLLDDSYGRIVVESSSSLSNALKAISQHNFRISNIDFDTAADGSSIVDVVYGSI